MRATRIARWSKVGGLSRSTRKTRAGSAIKARGLTTVAPGGQRKVWASYYSKLPLLRKWDPSHESESRIRVANPSRESESRIRVPSESESRIRESESRIRVPSESERIRVANPSSRLGFATRIRDSDPTSSKAVVSNRRGGAVPGHSSATGAMLRPSCARASCSLRRRRRRQPRIVFFH